MNKINLKMLFFWVPVVILLVCIYIILNVWFYFPNTEILKHMDYEMYEKKFGSPSVVMEGKFIAWDKKIGFFKSAILISHERKISGEKSNLLIEKSLRLEIGNTSFRLYKSH